MHVRDQLVKIYFGQPMPKITCQYEKGGSNFRTFWFVPSWRHRVLYLSFSSAKADCESRNMLLFTPNLSIIIDSMQNSNVSLFWTGYKRMNQTHFYEKSTGLYAGCGSNAWTSLKNKNKGSSKNLLVSFATFHNQSDRVVKNTILKRTRFCELYDHWQKLNDDLLKKQSFAKSLWSFAEIERSFICKRSSIRYNNS